MLIKKIFFIFALLLLTIPSYLLINPATLLGKTDDLTLANKYFDLGLNELAIERYNKVIAQDPKNMEAHIKLGVIYLRTYGYPEAESKLRSAVALNPKNAEAYFYLGETFGIQKKYEEAISHFEKTVSLNPNYAKAFNNLAHIYFEKKLYDKALDTVKEALKLDPNLIAAHCTLGEIYEAIGEYEKAFNEFEISKNDPRYGGYAKSKINEIRAKIK